MGKMLNIVTPLHKRTVRDCEKRFTDDKVRCMLVAEQYGHEYWDGDRRYGYGGYKYMEGRQTPIAVALIEEYGLTNHSSVLDVGCGKGFLVYELTKLLPGIRVAGLDISLDGIEKAPPDVKPDLKWGDAGGVLPYGDLQFDLVVSINTLHNLYIRQLPSALEEIERVALRSYICVESYHDRQTQHNLQGWALTCNTFMTVSDWIWFYDQHDYVGDYEFVEF
jgi:ubiquinone/menaquinone biosynthesis C-methylase UbiE